MVKNKAKIQSMKGLRIMQKETSLEVLLLVGITFGKGDGPDE